MKYLYSVQGLMRAGVMTEAEKPLWYDVYKAFPPKYEPRYDSPAVDKEVVSILYPEDIIRAYDYFCFAE